MNSFFIDHLDSTEIPLFCDSNLTLRIEKDGYKSTEIEVQTGTAYMENIVREIQLEEIPCTQFITGDVLHKLDLSPTTEVQLSLYANDTLVREKFLLNESKFTFEVPCNTKYTLKAEKSGFEAVALPIKTGTGLQEIMGITILLSPRICAQEVQVSLFDTETTLTLSKFKARLLKNGELISEKNIINGNQSSFMLECNTAYTIALEKPGYASSSLEIVTDDSYAVIHERTVNMDALACEQFLKLEGTTATDSEALLTSEFELFRDGISIDVQGSFNKLKIPCNSAVQLKISSPGFEPKIIELNTSNEFDRITEMRVSFIKEVCEQDLKLTVADSQSKAEISNFEMLYQKDGKEVRQFIRSGNGVNVKVKCNTLNRFRIQKENYDILEFTVETNNLKGTALNETVYLTPTVCEQLISGRVLDADSGAALQKALLTITSGNTFSEDLNLDIDGNFSFIAKCEQTYLLKASLVNYSSEQVKFTTSKNNGGQIRKTLNLQREVEITTVAGQRLINTNNIVFELNKTDINMETAIELNKVVALLNKYPDLNLTVKSHTDSRAPDDLSLKLTEERSKAIRSYLVSKGIDPSRIQALGLGESELLNACSNGVKCTEEEHNINRRTEFIIGN